MSRKLVTEDWKKEYPKIILAKKHATASGSIGLSASDPSMENVKHAYGRIMDFITEIPIGDNTEYQKQRNKFLIDLDEIGKIIYGNPKITAIKKLYKKHEIRIRRIRQGAKLVHTIENIPELISKLRDILTEAGDFATSIGLRITLPTEKKYGLDRLEEEEGFDIDDFEEEIEQD